METRNMKQGAMVLVVLMLLTTLTGAAKAYEGKKGWSEEDKAAHMEKMVKDLGLSEEQQAQMKEHKETQKQSTMETRKRIKAAREELKAELEKYDSDQGKIEALTNEIAEGQKAMMQQRTQGVAAMKEILTEEQYKQLQDKRTAKKEEWKGKKGKHQHSHDGEGKDHAHE